VRREEYYNILIEFGANIELLCLNKMRFNGT
jgi:hypothetical protein